MTLCDEIYRIAKQEVGMMSDVLSERGYNNEKSLGPMVASNLEEIKGYISKYNPSAASCREPFEDIQDLTKRMQSTTATFNQYIAEIAGVSLEEFSSRKSVEPRDVIEDIQNIRCTHKSFISHVKALDPKIDTMGSDWSSEKLEIALIMGKYHIKRAESHPDPYRGF